MDTVGARGKMQQNQEIMSTDGPHSCSYCHFKCYDNTSLMKHMKDCHSHEPEFGVSCTLCGQTYQKWDSLKKHLQRMHKSIAGPSTSISIPTG